MPKIELKGLKGLRGLSADEQQNFRQKQIAAGVINANASDEEFETLYRNKQFIDKFGIDAFRSYNPKEKSKLLQDALVEEDFKSNFKNDDNFLSLTNELDTQGKYDLLHTTNYTGTIERKRLLSEGLKTANKRIKDLNVSEQNPIAAAFRREEDIFHKNIASANAAVHPYDRDRELAKKDQEITDKLFTDTQKRREEEVAQYKDNIYSAMLSADNNGTKSLSQNYKEFDKLASEASPHYSAFKDSKWLKNYTDEDKLKDYSQYIALKNTYNEGVAKMYLDRTIQNKVAEAQDWSFTGNTLKGIATTAWSDLGSYAAVASHIGESPERIGIWNQGKDPDKPIRDEKGNIVDYEKNENWVNNPAYWNNVYKYNTFSPTEIKAIEERGGISKDVNVREFGYTPAFLSFDTAEEAAKQSGHIFAGIVETGLTGAIGKGLGTGIRLGLKTAGLSQKALATAAKAGNVINDILVGASTGLEDSQLEAMGTFEEQMQSAKEKVQDQIKRELNDYLQSINYDDPVAKEIISDYYYKLKNQDEKRVAATRGDGIRTYLQPEQYLREQAKTLYTNQLLSEKQEELENLHQKDLLEASKVATATYAANFAMDYIKNIPLTLGIQKYMVAKGAMRNTFDNNIADDIVEDALTGGVKRRVVGAHPKRKIGIGKFSINLKASDGKEINYTSAKNLAKNTVKQLAAGFADEYLDGVNASFASGMGNNEFDAYIRKTYDPESYNAATESFLGNVLSGVSEGTRGLTDRQNLYEGFIGMIAAGTTVGPNANALFKSKDTWRALSKGIDEKGNKLNFAERASTIISNPLLNTYAELRNKQTTLESAVNSINNVVAANKDKLHDASRIFSVLGNMDNPLQFDTFKLDKNSDARISLLDSKDNKLYNAFTLIDVLNTLEQIPGGNRSPLYNETMHTIEGLANNTLSEDELENEVDKFLAEPDNKSILDENPLYSRDTAKERLQKNAEYFLDMKNRLDEINNLFNSSSSLKNVDPRVKNILAYNLVSKEDYNQRLADIENRLGLSATNTEEAYTPDYAVRYGTKKAVENALKANERLSSSIEKESNAVADKIHKTEEHINSLHEDASEEDAVEKAKQETLLKTLKFQQSSLSEQADLLAQEKEALNNLLSDKFEKPKLSENSILRLDARDRAEILNPVNINNYDKNQQKVINRTLNKLKQRDPDAANKILDAGILASRIEGLNTIYDRISRNADITASYLDAVDTIRLGRAEAESLQREIANTYSKLNKAYAKADENQEELKNTVLSSSSRLIKAYMEDFPEKENVIKPYAEILDYEDTLNGAINSTDITDMQKLAVIGYIQSLHSNINTKEELEQELVKASNSENKEFADIFKNLLNTVNAVNESRETSSVENKEADTQYAEQQEKEKIEREELSKEANEIAKEEADIQAAQSGEAVLKSLKEVDLDFGEEPQEASSAETIFEKEGTVDIGNVGVGDNTVSIKATNSNGHIVFSSANRKVLSFAIQPKDWEYDEHGITENNAKDKQITKDTPFIAESLDKIGNNWYFTGTFANDKSKSKVKVSKSFKLEDLITNNSFSSAQNTTDAKGSSEGTYFTSDDTNTQANDVSLEEQILDSENPDSYTIVDSSGLDDALNYNDEAKLSENYRDKTLSGSAMPRYDREKLQTEGTLVNRKGAEEGDNMETFFAWMDNAGIKYQNIIDHELWQIIQGNPHTKVKFMAVRPDDNATHDADMQSHLMLVLDYDNKINPGITEIHSTDNGGIIESLGKKYLIIGTVGYGENNLSTNKERMALYDTLYSPVKGQYGLVRGTKGQFFREHPSERFYIHPTLSTEIVPRSIIPGWLVKQLPEESEQDRSVLDLLEQPRNPYGLTIENLRFGIQKGSEFLVTGDAESVMSLRRPKESIGRAFVLLPASNGKYLPSYIKPKTYSEIKEGALSRDITSTLIELTSASASYDDRLKALTKLRKIFHFESKDGNNIGIHKDNSGVTLFKDGNKLRTFLFDNTFSFDSFVEVMKQMDPLINLTIDVFENPENIKKYAEAGALDTDAALLGTVGSSFEIYGIDPSGKMLNSIVPEVSADQNIYKNPRGNQVIYNHKFYREIDGGFYLNGEQITDENLIGQLRTIQTIISSGIKPVQNTKNWKTYILNKEESKVVKVQNNTKKVVFLSKDEADEIISKNTSSEESAIITDNTKAVTEFEDTQQESIAETEDQNLYVDQLPFISEEESDSAEPVAEETTSSSDSSSDKIEFTTVIRRDPDLYQQVLNLIFQKWPDAPKKMSGMENFLRAKNIDTLITDSEEGIQTWLKTIEDCRP